MLVCNLHEFDVVQVARVDFQGVLMPSLDSFNISSEFNHSPGYLCILDYKIINAALYFKAATVPASMRNPFLSDIFVHLTIHHFHQRTLKKIALLTQNSLFSTNSMQVLKCEIKMNLKIWPYTPTS